MCFLVKKDGTVPFFFILDVFSCQKGRYRTFFQKGTGSRIRIRNTGTELFNLYLFQHDRVQVQHGHWLLLRWKVNGGVLWEDGTSGNKGIGQIYYIFYRVVQFESQLYGLCHVVYRTRSFHWIHLISVVDPDPHVFGPPGSGSTSQRYGSGFGSFYHHPILLLFLTLYLWKMM
jgi:hypothetical protein